MKRDREAPSSSLFAFPSSLFFPYSVTSSIAGFALPTLSGA